MSLSDGYEVITLDLKENTYKEIEVHQLDSTILNFNIVNYGIAVDLTTYAVEFRCVKPNGSYVVQNTAITKNSSGRVQIDCISEIVSYDGKADCELRLVNSTDNTQTTTFNIVLIIKKSVMDGVNESPSFVITALERLNDDLDAITVATSNAEAMNTTLTATKNSADTMNTTLTNTTTSATTSNNTLNATITNVATTQTSATTFKNTFTTDITTIQNNATTFKTNFQTGITNISTPANVLLTDLQNQATTSNTTLVSLVNNNNIAESNIDILNQYQGILPSHLELLHSNLNMIGMLFFMERSQNTKVTGVDNNMYINSFRDASGVTLDNTTFDSVNYKILIGDGYIQGIGYCYE